MQTCREIYAMISEHCRCVSIFICAHAWANKSGSLIAENMSEEDSSPCLAITHQQIGGFAPVELMTQSNSAFFSGKERRKDYEKRTQMSEMRKQNHRSL